MFKYNYKNNKYKLANTYCFKSFSQKECKVRKKTQRIWVQKKKQNITKQDIFQGNVYCSRINKYIRIIGIQINIH